MSTKICTNISCSRRFGRFGSVPVPPVLRVHHADELGRRQPGQPPPRPLLQGRPAPGDRLVRQERLRQLRRTTLSVSKAATQSLKLPAAMAKPHRSMGCKLVISPSSSWQQG